MSINTIVHRKLRVLAGCLLIILVGLLAGCGNDTGDGTAQSPDTNAETRVYQTSDGRRVTCIVITRGLVRTPEAMSCDWIHADGSDWMGAES